VVHRDVGRVLVSEQEIARRVDALATQIARDLSRALEEHPCVDAQGRPAEPRVVLVPVLTGAIVFVADLIRKLPLKLRLGVVAVSSYPGASVTSKGAALRSALPPDLTGTHVLVVDDILDSGQTLALLHDLISEQKPASVRTCVLLRKPGKAVVPFEADYVGFDIEDAFVVGYGLDYDGFYRNLPFVAELSPERRT
jgi:hypoxanthine phosphoribosyltransferase